MWNTIVQSYPGCEKQNDQYMQYPYLVHDHCELDHALNNFHEH
jgi:hypothetical protein